MDETRQTIMAGLEACDYRAITALIALKPRNLTHLVRLSYNKESLVGWRAILAVGMAARELIRTDPDFLRETCRKLLWSLSDESGGIGWSAPELLGEIVSADPVRFKDIVPLIASVFKVEEDVFRSGVLYALGRIAEKAPALVADHQMIIIHSLSDKDPLVRLRGVRLAGLLLPHTKKNNAWSREYCERIRSSLEELRKDDTEVWIYDETGFRSVIVKDESEKAILIAT